MVLVKHDFIMVPFLEVRETMDLLTPSLVGIGLSMDCFAVSLALGSTIKARLLYAASLIALCFGVFQAVMTLIGWGAGVSVIMLISSYDHWVAFILLAIVGGKMVWEGISGEDQRRTNRKYPVLPFDHTFDCDEYRCSCCWSELRCIPDRYSLACCYYWDCLFRDFFVGVMLGERLETVLGDKMEVLGGVILILIGVKILYEHMIG